MSSSRSNDSIILDGFIISLFYLKCLKNHEKNLMFYGPSPGTFDSLPFSLGMCLGGRVMGLRSFWLSSKNHVSQKLTQVILLFIKLGLLQYINKTGRHQVRVELTTVVKFGETPRGAENISDRPSSSEMFDHKQYIFSSSAWLRVSEHDSVVFFNPDITNLWFIQQLY